MSDDSVTMWKLSLAVCLSVFFMSGLWAVDIGASSMINKGYVEGLNWTRSGTEQYHLGLLMSLASFLLVCLLFLQEIVMKGRNS